METSQIVKLAGIPADAFASADGCWTIDQTTGTGDNGFLDCARAGHPGVGSDGNTKQAVDNLLYCLPPLGDPCQALVDQLADLEAQLDAETDPFYKRALIREIAQVRRRLIVCRAAKPISNIVGHGNDGIIVTGTGQHASDPLKYISWSNRNSWKANLQRLQGRTTTIRLWGCHPGTGQDGLNLLDYVCQETGAISMGPTGFLYCSGGNFSLEANSNWQVVTPGQPLPQPINAPTPHFTATFSNMKIKTEKGYEHIAAEDVTAVEIVTADGNRTIQKLTTSDSIDLVRAVGFDDPFTIDGVPGALITARVRVTFAASAAQLIGATREFIVWNDRQLEDVQHRGHFYHTQPGFRNLLRMMQ
jgi:hypothetical protein